MAKNNLTKDELDMFDEWIEDGNVSLVSEENGVKIYATQDAQYSNRLKGYDELTKYFKNNFLI